MVRKLFLASAVLLACSVGIAIAKPGEGRKATTQESGEGHQCKGGKGGAGAHAHKFGKGGKHGHHGKPATAPSAAN